MRSGSAGKAGPVTWWAPGAFTAGVLAGYGIVIAAVAAAGAAEELAGSEDPWEYPLFRSTGERRDG